MNQTRENVIVRDHDVRLGYNILHTNFVMASAVSRLMCGFAHHGGATPLTFNLWEELN